jgi:predicted nuclease of restriction endonuclease-like (RecB) superfamily
VAASSSVDQAGDYAEVKRGEGGERIMPLYLAVKNPYVITNVQKTRMKSASQAQINLITQSLNDMARDFQFVGMMQIHLRG